MKQHWRMRFATSCRTLKRRELSGIEGANSPSSASTTASSVPMLPTSWPDSAAPRSSSEHLSDVRDRRYRYDATEHRRSRDRRVRLESTMHRRDLIQRRDTRRGDFGWVCYASRVLDAGQDRSAAEGSRELAARA